MMLGQAARSLGHDISALYQAATNQRWPSGDDVTTTTTGNGGRIRRTTVDFPRKRLYRAMSGPRLGSDFFKLWAL